MVDLCKARRLSQRPKRRPQIRDPLVGEVGNRIVRQQRTIELSLLQAGENGASAFERHFAGRVDSRRQQQFHDPLFQQRRCPALAVGENRHRHVVVRERDVVAEETGRSTTMSPAAMTVRIG